MRQFNSEYPSVERLREKAKQRTPKFAFEYLDGGCNEDVNLRRNTEELREVMLLPKYLGKYGNTNLKTTIFGHEYDAPFGMAPIGLQGLIWPGSSEILARAAYLNNIPFILSTVATASIEQVGEITEGKFWFQLYNPSDEVLRNDILSRLKEAGCEVLVLLCDVPSFGFRPRDIKNGLAMPPKMSIRNALQIMNRPKWALKTLIQGKPEFKTLKRYMPQGMDLSQLGGFMDRTFSGRLDKEKIGKIRDIWPGKLVLKGVSTVEDAKSAAALGLDGIIVSNHGGRQLDAAESTIKSLERITKIKDDRLTVMMDSGLRSGPDIARSLASGAEFTFLGRTFMYSVSALGNPGGEHAISLLNAQLKQIMEQLGCENVADLTNHLVKAPR